MVQALEVLDPDIERATARSRIMAITTKQSPPAQEEVAGLVRKAQALAASMASLEAQVSDAKVRALDLAGAVGCTPALRTLTPTRVAAGFLCGQFVTICQVTSRAPQASSRTRVSLWRRAASHNHTSLPHQLTPLCRLLARCFVLWPLGQASHNLITSAAASLSSRISQVSAVVAETTQKLHLKRSANQVRGVVVPGVHDGRC